MIGHAAWDDPRIRAIGRRYALEAFDLADELNAYGADATQLLLSWRELDPDRPRNVAIPAMFADALMALLLSLPRPQERVGENVIRFRPSQAR
jgi:hypothetical protein